MRIKITFTDTYFKKAPPLAYFEKWIEFPCRLNDGDMLLEEVFMDNNYNQILIDYNIPNSEHPIVEGSRFEKDSKGVYQSVFIELDATLSS